MPTLRLLESKVCYRWMGHCGKMGSQSSLDRFRFHCKWEIRAALLALPPRLKWEDDAMKTRFFLLTASLVSLRTSPCRATLEELAIKTARRRTKPGLDQARRLCLPHVYAGQCAYAGLRREGLGDHLSSAGRLHRADSTDQRPDRRRPSGRMELGRPLALLEPRLVPRQELGLPARLHAARERQVPYEGFVPRESDRRQHRAEGLSRDAGVLQEAGGNQVHLSPRLESRNQQAGRRTAVCASRFPGRREEPDQYLRRW